MLWNTYVRPQDLPILRSNLNLKTIALEGAGKHGLLFNISAKPFDSKALRQAVAYSIDREKFVNVAFPGAGKPAYTHEESGWAHNPDIKPIVFDLAKAKQKLTEAGYPGGVTLPMGCQAIPEALERCEIYQAMLKEAGIKIDIVPIDPGKMFGPTGALKTVGFKSTNWAHRADPDITLRWIFHPDGFYNIAGYKNPEVIRLLDEAVGMYDIAKAKPLYDKIQTITAEEAIWVYAVWSAKFAAMNKTVQGYTSRTIIIEELQDLWLEK